MLNFLIFYLCFIVHNKSKTINSFNTNSNTLYYVRNMDFCNLKELITENTISLQLKCLLLLNVNIDYLLMFSLKEDPGSLL